MSGASQITKRRRAERRGRIAEWFAAMFLRIKGFNVVESRFRCPAGEVDIIARRGGLLVFVEVKSRASLEMAVEAVTPYARRRIGAAAQMFLSRRAHLADCAIRYDIVAVAGWRLRHLPDAWRDQS